MLLSKSKIPTIKLQEQEVGISRHLPFAYLDENDVVRTKNGDYLLVLKIRGISCATLEDEDVNFEQILRAKLLSAFSDPRFAIYHTIIRSKATAMLSTSYEPGLTAELAEDYSQHINASGLYYNDLYLTILYKGSGSKGNRVTSRINQWLTGWSHSLNAHQAEQNHQESVKTLHETVLRFLSTLEKYDVQQLGFVQTDQGLFSEPLQFFSRILNWNDAPRLAIRSGIDVYLPSRRLFFGNKSIESQGNTENDTRFAAMISLKEYPSTTQSGMLDALLALPIEMIVSQSFICQNRQNSRETIELQLRRLRQSRDPDQKGIRLLEQALGDLVAGDFGFGYHHFSVMVLAHSLSELENNIAEVEKQLSECGIVAIRERLNCEATFWAQFPGNFRYIVRKVPITTDNFAAFASLHNEPIGQKSNNHWGEAVTLLKTSGHQPYYFNFHKPNSDIGHTLIMGPTGSGKTLLACFLIAQALKHQIQVFYFDKDHGAEAFMRSIGAQYSVIGSEVSTGFNPLQLPDTPRNRHFLVEWLQSLFIVFGTELTNEELDIIHQAVRLNYEYLSPEQRTLANLAEAFGRGGPGSLRNRIDQWHSQGPFANYFGSEQDLLKIGTRFSCFEVGYLLDKNNDLVRCAVLFYLFYRIQLALEQTTAHLPAIICLDEAWIMLDNPFFASNIKNWLKTFRKRNAIVLLLSQEVTDISQSSISSTLHAETATKIFFPDASPIKSIYQDLFHLTEREINLLQAYSGDNRNFLIKQAHESVFAYLDLNHLKHWIPVLSGNNERIATLHRILEKYGDEPRHWLPEYIRELS